MEINFFTVFKYEKMHSEPGSIKFASLKIVWEKVNKLSCGLHRYEIRIVPLAGNDSKQDILACVP